MITNLTLKNFLAFTNLNIDFSPGINIIIGENGTGKTQLERENDILLVEIKDPSHSRSQEQDRKNYKNRLKNNSILTQELTPKARDSYLYLHLMERDNKPFKYIVLLGLDAFDSEFQKVLMSNFKDRLLADIRNESFEAWKRKHIDDCIVLSLESWNQTFPEWLLRRETLINQATTEEEIE